MTSTATTEFNRLLECCICLEGLKNCHICYHCSQPFCRTCIDEWIKKDRNCPSCRKDLLPTKTYLIKVCKFDQIQELMINETRNRCGQHPRDNLTLFCTFCKKCICASCLLSEHHRDHKDQAVLLDDIYCQYEGNLRYVLAKIDNRKTCIAASFSEIDVNMRNLAKQLQDEMKALEVNLSSFNKLQDRAHASLAATQDASTLQTIMEVLESAESFFSNEAKVSAEIDERLLKFSLLNPITLEFVLDRYNDDVDLVSEPKCVYGFRWVVKLASNNAVYLSLLAGVPGEYSVALYNKPAQLVRFELGTFMMLCEDAQVKMGLKPNSVVVVVHIQQARTFQEKCVQQEQYIRQLEARIAERKLPV